MAFHHSPKIVTSGLALCLDALNIKSYPGSGDIWYDLSGNNYDATLTTTSYNGKGIIFNGTTSLCRTTLPVSVLDNDCHVCFWFSRGSSPGADGSTSDRMISCDAVSSGTKWCIGINTSGDLQLAGSGGADGEPTFTIDVGVYYFCAVNFRGSSYDIFLNDVKQLDGETVGYNAASFGNMSIGCRPNSADRVFDGAIAWAAAYSGQLSDSEVKQNYDALKGRFGL